jgi:hypothetical protein
VTVVSVAQDGNIWFIYSGAMHGVLPACAHPNGLWIVTPDQKGYQGLLATLLSVQARGASVFIRGTDECGSTDHERVAYIDVH